MSRPSAGLRLLPLLMAAAAAAFGAERPATALAAAEAHDRRVCEAVVPAVVGITCRTATGAFFGTGVTVSADGFILTSTTVVPPGAARIRVFFSGTLQKEARLVGTDAETEAALIKVDAQELAFVPLADSTAARAGDPAYTFGNPFGTLSSDDKVSCSAGHLSGVYRLPENGDYQSTYSGRVLETDAAVNPGSDGGPLVDGQGRLLGILCLGFSERRWLGTAVPVDVIAPRFAALRDIRPAAERFRPPEQVSLAEAAWRAAVGRVAPAVVQVLVERDEKPPPRPPRDLNPAQQIEETKKRYEMRPAGPASGVLVSADGQVLTSWFHLTGAVRSVKVRLADGRELPAKVLGRDEALDVVMLKAEGQDLPAAGLAAEDDPEIGSALAVVGRTEDAAQVTVNRGILSAKGRGRGARLMQISAMINYGNLGGPAIDCEGRLLGVTGQLRPKSLFGQNSGVGFVASASAIRAVLADLAAGKVAKQARTLLGVSPGTERAEVRGAPVGKVQPNTAAAAAGLRSGDLVTAIDGVPVESWGNLVRTISARKPGDKVKLTVERKDETLELEATLGQSDD